MLFQITCAVGNAPPTHVLLLWTILTYAYFENTDQKGSCLCPGPNEIIFTLFFFFFRTLNSTFAS